MCFSFTAVLYKKTKYRPEKRIFCCKFSASQAQDINSKRKLIGLITQHVTNSKKTSAQWLGRWFFFILQKAGKYF
jgi:hypothetical protein